MTVEEFDARYESVRTRVGQYCSPDNLDRDWATQNTLRLTLIAMRCNILATDLEKKYHQKLILLEDELMHYSPSTGRSAA